MSLGQQRPSPMAHLCAWSAPPTHPLQDRPWRQEGAESGGMGPHACTMCNCIRKARGRWRACACCASAGLWGLAPAPPPWLRRVCANADASNASGRSAVDATHTAPAGTQWPTCLSLLLGSHSTWGLLGAKRPGGKRLGTQRALISHPWRLRGAFFPPGPWSSLDLPCQACRRAQPAAGQEACEA
jgi:hypothetical protein